MGILADCTIQQEKAETITISATLHREVEHQIASVVSAGLMDRLRYNPPSAATYDVCPETNAVLNK